MNKNKREMILEYIKVLLLLSFICFIKWEIWSLEHGGLWSKYGNTIVKILFILGLISLLAYPIYLTYNYFKSNKKGDKKDDE